MPLPKMDFFLAEIACIPPVPTTPAPSTMPFRFMDLPVELRVQVYTYLVLVDKVFYTPSTYEQEESQLYRNFSSVRQPHLTILRVSKITHEEAGHLYLTANVFVLPHRWMSLFPFDPDSPKGQTLFSDAAVKKIKHIALMLDSRSSEWALTMYRSDWNIVQVETNLSFDHMTPEERLEIVHSRIHGLLPNFLPQMSEEISAFESLQFICLDVANAYCPIGSCRIFDFDWDEAFRHVKNIQFFVQSSHDSAEILETWMDQAQLTPEKLDQRFHITFVIDDWGQESTAATL